MSMKGYTNDTILYAGRSPATDGFFETRVGAELVAESVRSWFHSVVAKLSYLAKRAKPECLTAVAYLATRVTRCTTDDVEKLKRVMKYVSGTCDRGVVFRPGQLGICVRVFIDAAYGVHSDGKSHTGSCVVIGDVGAVHCKSSKQSIVTKSSTEAELIPRTRDCTSVTFLSRRATRWSRSLSTKTTPRAWRWLKGDARAQSVPGTLRFGTSGFERGLLWEKRPQCTKGQKRCTRTYSLSRSRERNSCTNECVFRDRNNRCIDIAYSPLRCNN